MQKALFAKSGWWPLLALTLLSDWKNKSAAFAFSSSSTQNNHHHATSTRLYSSPPVIKVNGGRRGDQQQHSHSLLWEMIIEQSPDSYANPAIELAIRSPEEGGTGILAVENLKKDTVVLRLPLEQVGMIDAGSILDNVTKGEDEVLDMLNQMRAESESSSDVMNEHGSGTNVGQRLAVLVGIIAHLQLTRYKEKTDDINLVQEGYALQQSRRLGLFLDAMPLLPQQPTPKNHPFPTHFLYWDDDEIEHLLQGTMAQTCARQLRAGVGLLVREWSTAFLKEHSTLKQSEILNAIFSAFTAVLSRSFGDTAGRDLSGAGRMLVPLVDMLNHDSEDPNVRWTWHVGEGDEDKIKEGRGNISVSTLRDVNKGEELYKCYGWGAAYEIASNYGFVPRLKNERWECSVVPLFPAVLDLAPDVIATPNQISSDETSLDLLLESNYGGLVKAIVAAVDAACEIEERNGSEKTSEDQTDRPAQLDRLEVVSLFRPAPELTKNKFPFPRRQPCVVVGTKIGASEQISFANRPHHREAIEKVLPAYRAAACALAQIRRNHKNDDSLLSIDTVELSIATVEGSNWDEAALKLLRMGINDRIETITRDGKAASAWLTQSAARNRLDKDDLQHRQFRSEMSSDIRSAELNVLQTLSNELEA